MKENDDYCGFLCSDIIERQQKIMEDIDDFATYNEEFAKVMRLKVLKMCLDETMQHGMPKITETTDALAISQ